ncbi:hypothetical protein AVEN_172664-1 [Araneus ventricosus]|uniref:Uncharacterized protein n=1 Tax=Araneus ventricosus TaxID=182803 RepID=A0A4Y2HL87_ARAVE|nr:hypothetical protein AVEN_172664-1 [Araneus ventricosus]
MYAFNKQLIYDNGKIQNLHQICLLNCLIFVKVWLNAQKEVDAPVNDLMFWEYLNMYEKYDPEVALFTLSRHLWYLAEAVIFSLFSKKVSDSEKKKIVDSLMKYKANEKSIPPLLYGFPVLNQTIKLHQLVGPKSWLIFSLVVNQDGACLKINPQA